MTTRKDQRGGDAIWVAGDKSRHFRTLPSELRTTGRLRTREEIQAHYGIKRKTFSTLTYSKRTAIHASKRGR